MKKIVAVVLILICVFTFSACGGNVGNVKITDYSSKVYTDNEIKDAINVTLDYFKKEFSGCTLKEITYIGDDKLNEYQEFAERNNADDVIVLISTYDVGASGGDGSLNPNSTYKNWNWILVRNKGENWKHVDHGY